MFSEIGTAAVTVGLIAGLGFGGPAIVRGFQDAFSEGYTGTAVIKEHYPYGSFCNISVELSDGTRELMVAGPKPVCGNIIDGTSINIVEGNIRN